MWLADPLLRRRRPTKNPCRAGVRGRRAPGVRAAQEQVTSLEGGMYLPGRADHSRLRAHLDQMQIYTHVGEESRDDAMTGLDLAWTGCSAMAGR